MSSINISALRRSAAFIAFLFVIVWSTDAKAATVDTANTYSAAMHKSIKAVIVKPNGYSKNQKYPVVYLLHGFSGNYSDWILKVPAIKTLADDHQLLIVCPDGAFASWYFDSPLIKDSQYETYIVKELTSYIDKAYSTIASRKGRAITGLSMGGHGALFLAFKHQDVFGAAGSMSGGVDIRIFADKFGIEQVLGKYSENKQRWEDNSVTNMLYLIKPNALALIIDCARTILCCPPIKSYTTKCWNVISLMIS